VEGLVDNLSNQISGVTVTVTGATNSGSLPAVFTDANSSIGDGFDVSGGQVTGVDIFYYNSLTDLLFSLANNNQNGLRNEYTDLSSFGNEEADGSPANSLHFTPINPPSAPVPAPYPSSAPLPPSAGVASYGAGSRLPFDRCCFNLLPFSAIATTAMGRPEVAGPFLFSGPQPRGSAWYGVVRNQGGAFGNRRLTRCNMPIV